MNFAKFLRTPSLQNTSEQLLLTLATKADLKVEQDKTKASDSSCFHGKSHFEDDGTQNYLMFHPIYRYLKKRLAIMMIFQHGNLKNYLMKALKLLLHLIIVLLLH